MKRIEQLLLLALLADIFLPAGVKNSGLIKNREISSDSKNQLEESLTLNPLLKQVSANLNYGILCENNPFSGIRKNNAEQTHITPSQAAVDSIIKADNEVYYQTGKGLYIGRPEKSPKGIRKKDIDKNHLSVDCYNALEIILNAEIPNEKKEIIKNSKDQDGNFSAPFMVEYLVKNKNWEAYGYYIDHTKYRKLKGKTIRDEDLIIKVDKSEKTFYKAGGAMFPLNDFIPIAQADSLLKELVLERGYALGFQRDGTHCYALVQKGLFEIHVNSFPLGYNLEEGISFRPLDLHWGVYHARSSIAVFAFPPRQIQTQNIEDTLSQINQ